MPLRGTRFLKNYLTDLSKLFLNSSLSQSGVLDRSFFHIQVIASTIIFFKINFEDQKNRFFCCVLISVTRKCCFSKTLVQTHGAIILNSKFAAFFIVAELLASYRVHRHTLQKKAFGGRSYSFCNFLYIFITDHKIFSLEYVLFKPDLFILNKPLKIAKKKHKNVLIFLDHNVYNPLSVNKPAKYMSTSNNVLCGKS